MADRTQNLRQREKGQIIRAFSWIKARWLNAEGQNTGNEQPQSRDALKTKIPPKVNYKSELLKTFFFFFLLPRQLCTPSYLWKELLLFKTCRGASSFHPVN